MTNPRWDNANFITDEQAEYLAESAYESWRDYHTPYAPDTSPEAMNIDPEMEPF